MSDTAQRRDLGDPKTILTFSEKVERSTPQDAIRSDDLRYPRGRARRMEPLEVRIDSTLYWETENVLAGDHSTIGRGRRVTEARTNCESGLPQWTSTISTLMRTPSGPLLAQGRPRAQMRHAKLLNMPEVGNARAR